MERDLMIDEETQSAVAWPAIFAGAVAGLALSLVLISLAAGFGFELAAPWPSARAVPGAFTPIAGAVMVAVQVLSAGLGGYLAGRLRTRWLNVHSHEVHFRDTAHGLVAWALMTVIGAALVATILAPPAGRLADAAIAQVAASQALLPPPQPLTADPAALPGVPDLAVAQAEALRQSHIAAQMSFFVAFGLLLSAFTACVAAALGGLRRDEMVVKYRAEASRPT
jgi:hypothetical protein